MFVDLFQGHGLTEVQPWVISGDFNEKPHDGVLGKLFEAYAGHYVGVGNPTRWDGNSEVDWFSTNRLQRVLQVDTVVTYISRIISPLDLSYNFNLRKPSKAPYRNLSIILFRLISLITTGKLF